MKTGTTILVTSLILIAGACWALRHRIAVMMAPQKQQSATRSAAAVKADEIFWATFHGGDYENIQDALELLTAAYLKSPNDAKTAAHIAWLHNWRVAERARLMPVPATITDDTIVARRYFEEAVQLDPTDPRTQGFLAGHLLAEGSVNHDERLTRKGYFMMLEAIAAWPEFNLFTGGYVLSRLPATSKQFLEGLEWQWRTLDKCIHGKLDRGNPDYARYMHLETTKGAERVCWNSWIAPHNLEGFFLNMGDMLVKSGDWRTAQKIYANAKLSRTYADWKYQAVLDDRIQQAQANVQALNSKDDVAGARMMIDSEFACMACHRE
jgi:hypothetical protein